MLPGDRDRRSSSPSTDPSPLAALPSSHEEPGASKAGDTRASRGSFTAQHVRNLADVAGSSTLEAGLRRAAAEQLRGVLVSPGVVRAVLMDGKGGREVGPRSRGGRICGWETLSRVHALFVCCGVIRFEAKGGLAHARSGRWCYRRDVYFLGREVETCFKLVFDTVFVFSHVITNIFRYYDMLEPAQLFLYHTQLVSPYSANG